MDLVGAYQLPPCVDKSLGEAIGMASTGGNFPFAFGGVRCRVGVFDFIAVHGGYYLLTLVFHDQAESITEAVTGYEARLARADLPNIPFHSEPLINGHKDYANLGISQRKAMLAYFSSFVRKLPISYTTFAYRRSEFADLDKLAERMRRDISEERCADVAWPCGTRPA